MQQHWKRWSGLLIGGVILLFGLAAREFLLVSVIVWCVMLIAVAVNVVHRERLNTQDQNKQIVQPRWERWSARLLAGAFGANFIIHVLTFVDFRVTLEWPVVISLIAAVALSWFAAIVGIMAQGDTPTAEPDQPRWADLMAIGLVLYALANGGICGKLMEWAGPARTATGYILQSHGRFIRSLTEAEYWRMEAYNLRFFTGSFMSLLGWPLLHFLFHPDPPPWRKDRSQAAA